MKIIVPHKNPSALVKSWGQIKKDAKAIDQMMKDADYSGKWKDAYAIQHAQVAEHPFNFFVINPKILEFKHSVIINPRIVGKDDKMMKREACMSYPFRNTVRVRRYAKIKVEFQVKGLLGLKEKVEDLEGFIAEVFQHEIDHAHSRYIYDT